MLSALRQQSASSGKLPLRATEEEERGGGIQEVSVSLAAAKDVSVDAASELDSVLT